MSAKAIRRLADTGVFEPVEGFGELSDNHVNFDQLVGGNARETALARLLRRKGPVKVAVSGPSGSGKSSLIAGTLADLATHLPLRIEVAQADIEILQSQTNFGQFIIREIYRQAKANFKAQARLGRRQRKAIERASADWQTHSTPGATVTGTVGIPKYANIAVQVTSAITATSSHTNPSQSLEGLEEVARVFANEELGVTPVLIVDDADKWARSPNADETTRRAELLFSTALQPLLTLPIHLIVAVQDDWPALAQFHNLEKRLTQTITIPEFPADAIPAIGQIIAHRAVDLDDVNERLDTLLDDGALARLEAEYDHGGRSIRRVLRVLDVAVKDAAAETPVPDRLNRGHIRAAARQLKHYV
jgi:energy-coupling factor transporter ATP-binding protein EcfA2